MASVSRADGKSGGCSNGGKALEIKRRRRVQLERNNGGGKDREEGTKMRVVAVVAVCTTGRRLHQHRLWQRWVWEEDNDKGGAATSSLMEAQGKDNDIKSCDCNRGLEMVAPSRGRRGVERVMTAGPMVGELVVLCKQRCSLLLKGKRELVAAAKAATIAFGVEQRKILCCSPCIFDKGGQRLQDSVADDRWGSDGGAGLHKKRVATIAEEVKGEAEEAVASAWGATNCGCGCYDPREAITGLGRQRLVLLRSRVGNAARQREVVATLAGFYQRGRGKSVRTLVEFKLGVDLYRRLALLKLDMGSLLQGI
ncbi:hypothetical protein BHE74_00055545 [Ensete ventricosum]|nr:hypothetical protein BHE74_00055545 [Ensete ventricosum]